MLSLSISKRASQSNHLAHQRPDDSTQATIFLPIYSLDMPKFRPDPKHIVFLVTPTTPTFNPRCQINLKPNAGTYKRMTPSSSQR